MHASVSHLLLKEIYSHRGYVKCRFLSRRLLHTCVKRSVSLPSFLDGKLMDRTRYAAESINQDAEVALVRFVGAYE